LIGRAYKNITVNEINWLNEIDDNLSIELLDENDESNIKLKISPQILTQRPSKNLNSDIISIPNNMMGQLNMEIK
jgi:hypothetical protein